MTSHGPRAEARASRDFSIAGHKVNSYKVLLCVGIYVGVLVSAAVAQRSGLSPLRVGLGGLVVALLGLIGARVYHLLVFAPKNLRGWPMVAVMDSEGGGAGVLGSLLAVPATLGVAWALRIPASVFWDHLSVGIVAGGFWVRLGCVFNGCCGGRATTGWYGIRLHDVRGVRNRRIPVQCLEMAWWLIGAAGLVWLWPKSFPSGNYALGVLAWYGLGRAWLDPLREAPGLVAGRVRINQVVAAALALVAGGAILLRTFAS
jgi:phosphatidylglycerol---prolipoprotein diacylglyceryl transferase